MKRVQSRLTRRNFLLAAGAGGAAATAALVTGKSPGPVTEIENKTAGGKGYHVTEHIRNYYRTAKV